MKTRLHNLFFKPIDASIVSVFRIIFGAFMVYQMIHYLRIDYVFQFMSGPQLLFPFHWLTFLKPLSLTTLKVINVGMLISALLITLGYFYRYAMAFFFLGFTYFTFIDKTLFNNHLYLISLIALVMIFINADEKYSLKAKQRGTVNASLIPAWNQYLLAFLISLPYFYGGIAKLSSNWLQTDLPKILVQQSGTNWLRSIFSDETLAAFLTHGGLIYDLGIVFLLLYKRTRLLGVVLVLIFNLFNHTILFDDIGLFPFLMICSSILFFNPEKVGKFLGFIFMKGDYKEEETAEEAAEEIQEVDELTDKDLLDNSNVNWTTSKRITLVLIGSFILFQLIFPFRHHLLTDNPEWTGLGNHFAWRMKMQTRQMSESKWTMIDRKTGDKLDIELNTFLTTNQLIHISEDPYNYVHLAKHMRQVAIKKFGDVDPMVNADMKVNFNGLHPQRMFSETLNLCDIEEKLFSTDSWMFPLKLKP